MQAVADCTFATSGPTTRLLKIGDVVRQFNLCETTIRRAGDSGKLKTYRLPSGHRRFSPNDVRAFLGVSVTGENVNGGIPIACCIRVSSDGQNRRVGNSEKSSLEHQEDRVREYVTERWQDQARVTWYRRVSSGMKFECQTFLKLVSDLLEGKFSGGFVVCTDKTRLARFGTALVEHLAKRGGAEVIYTMGNSEGTLNETLSDEILSILTHYTAKASGAKAKIVCETRIDEATLKDTFLLHRQGFSFKAIAERFAKEGRGTDPKGRKITRNVLWRRVRDNWQALEKLYSAESTPQNSFEQFVEKHVRRIDTGRKLTRKAILKAYGEFCASEGLPELSDKKISKIVTRLQWERCFDSRNLMAFRNLALSGNLQQQK